MAGVAAAVFLSNTDHRVVLLEARHELGGNARTVVVRNAVGERVAIDIGPQYFQKGPWNLYIQLLKFFNLYDDASMIRFKPTLGVIRAGKSTPLMITPRLRFYHLFNVLRWRNLAALRALDALLLDAYQRNRAAVQDYGLTAEGWIRQLDMSDKIKKTVVWPFLSSLIGTTLAQTKSLSALSLIKLFAYYKPCLFGDNRYLVSTVGMGRLIQKLAQKLPRRQVRTSFAVSKVHRRGSQLEIHSKKGEIVRADHLIIATHPREALQFLQPLIREQPSLHSLRRLDQLPYIKARVVLHRNQQRPFVDGSLPTYLSVFVDDHDEVTTNMNLVGVDKRYRGIVKSWINDDALYRRTKNQLASSTFYHPLMTPRFIRTVGKIKQQLAGQRQIGLAGGWTTGHETQATAIRSAFDAVQSLGLLSRDQDQQWRYRLPALDARDL